MQSEDVLMIEYGVQEQARVGQMDEFAVRKHP
jgi:hypothetical protein